MLLAMKAKMAGLMAATSVGSRLMNVAVKVFVPSHIIIVNVFKVGNFLLHFTGKHALFMCFGCLGFDDFADWFCTIRIVDASYQKGLSVNVFAEHIGALPHVASFGDIAQLSHVMVSFYPLLYDCYITI